MVLVSCTCHRMKLSTTLKPNNRPNLSERVATHLDPALAKELNQQAQAHGVSQAQVLRSALEVFLQSLKQEQQS